MTTSLPLVPKIVWIGSPATAPYLAQVHEPLRQLAQSHSFVLRVIGGGSIQLEGVPVENLAWSESTEVTDLQACDIGIMPLVDSLWERGKCGYKLIQYMACGLPVVASQVGANSQIVTEGIDGFLVTTADQWQLALATLLDNAPLRIRMGAMGRQKVEQTYCTQVAAPVLAHLFDEMVNAHRSGSVSSRDDR